MARMIRLAVAMLFSSVLVSCGGGSGSGGSTSACSEDGPYACMSGATEPLYTYQWALNAVMSYFSSFSNVSDGATDLNVETVHTQGIKGQGVNVLVLDDGLEINHIDLKANINTSMTWNFQTNSADPTPADGANAHGTNVAGIIGAVQNGIGVMGVAPRVTLGGARYISLPKGVTPNAIEAYGGASWSKNADIFNASYGSDEIFPQSYDQNSANGNTALQNFPNLRNGKGAIMVRAAGNGYQREVNAEFKFGYYCPQFSFNGTNFSIDSCSNPSFDTETLELPVVVAAAANAKGYKSSYSSAGSVVWITGLGGELTSTGKYGEAGSAATENGPLIYSTDLMGCDRGYSTFATSLDDNPQFMKGGTSINLQSNSGCNFDQMNGTSAATPTVTGVVALMLSANPSLGWRDIRDILRKTARPINMDYGNQDNRNHQVNLTLDPTLSDDISPVLVDGSASARIDYGWQINAAGNKYSNWYGFGLVDAKAAVAMAQTYSAYKSTALIVPGWSAGVSMGTVKYGQVKNLGTFMVSSDTPVDMIQVRLNASQAGADICMGSVGVFLKSPQGTVSILNEPYNLFYGQDSPNANDARNGGKITTQSNFVLGSYAFYGESSKGSWTVYAVSGTPLVRNSCQVDPKMNVDYRIYGAQ